MVSAAVLPPGGAVALFGSSPSGVLIWDQVRPYSIDDAGGTTIYGGDIHEQVLRQSDGTMTFRWRLENTFVDVPSAAVDATVTSYSGLFTDVEWDPSGAAGGGDAPSMATRTGDGVRISYDFSSNPVFETEESVFFHADTDSMLFGEVGTITIRVDSGESATITTVGPIVDDTPPIAEIQEPQPFDCICNPTDIYGIADDPDNTYDSHWLEYRPINSPTWTQIGFSTTPVPAPGGFLFQWNTTGVAQGYYLLRLTVENILGLSTSVVTVVWVDQQFDNLTYSSPANGDAVGGNVCPSGIIDDHCSEQYELEYSSDGVNFFDIDGSMPVYNGPKINQSFGVWDSTTVSDGNYFLRVTAYDPCGFVAQETHSIIVDNTAPTVEITDPLNCECVEGLVEIYGTADDANLASWVLQYSGGNNNNWVTINSDTVPVINGLLGVWDTTLLPNCPYVLRLVASDTTYLNCNGAIHHISDYQVTVNVGCDACPSDSDGSGVVDVEDLLDLLAAWGPCL
ncbi:MAG: hypothetical protein O7G85_11475 [Planctomycetota bacterium]|nr:hypothetical protein [Planctomycetota bacterium]